MSKCPNCGLETMRTEDWACQWCGYPLPFGPFKKIEKTYRQLKDEREDRTGTVQQAELEQKIELKQDMETIKGINLEIETGEEGEEEQEIEDKAESVQEIEKEAEPEEVKPEAKEETEGEEGEEKKPVQEIEAELEQSVELEEEPQKETKVTQEVEPEIELMQEPEPESEPEPPDMELSIGELLAAYDEDDIAADEKFVNKVLRVTGVVSMIDIKDMLDRHYIRLTTGKEGFMQSLQCMFEKKHAPALRELEKGQTVTVQGRYNGSVIAMRIVDCVIIQ